MFKRALFFLVFTCLGVTSPAQTFSPAVDYSSGASPQEIVAGDFNDDGNLDLIVANGQSNSLSFFSGQGNGTFAQAKAIPLNGSPAFLAAADFNGDGKLDLAVSFTTVTGETADLEVLYGNGDGTFQAPITLHRSSPGTTQFGIGKIVAADMNGDGRPDIIAALNGVAVFLNQSGGVFEEAGTAFSGMDVEDFAIADLNKDGSLDIAVLTMNTGTGGVSGQVFIADGKGDGTFATATPLPFTTAMPGGIAISDINQDGRLDVVLCDYGQVSSSKQRNGSIQILLQQADGSFVASAALTAVQNPWRVMLGDFGNSGHLDIATLTIAVPESSTATTNELIVYPGNGDGTFQSPNQFALDSAPWDLISAPLSANKALSIATTNPLAGTISVLLNTNSSQTTANNATVTAFSAAPISSSQTSGPAATPFTITSSLNPSIYGQAITFTANGNFTCPNCTNAPGPPSGTVTFYDGAAILGTTNLSGASAGLTTSSLAAGSHVITVQFSSTNPAFGSGSGGPLTQTVNQSSTSTSLSSSVNPSVFGQPITFTIDVNPVAPGAGTPTGSVSILDGGTSIGAATLSGGQASFPISILPVGQNNIAASYQGDQNFKASASSILTEVVNRDSATTSLTSSANPSVYGQPVTFADTENAAPPGAGVPTGNITFFDGTTDLAITALNGGHATLTTSTLSVGGHSVTASYGGDNDFNASTSSAVVQIVNKSQTSISFASSANPSVYGQTITLTATVSAVAPGVGIPSGNITLLDGSTSLGSFTLSSGQASVTLSVPAVGAHDITASYAGDNNFLSSTASLTQTVNKASTVITATNSPNPSLYGQTVSLTIAVGAIAPGTGTPTGTVTVTDHGTSLGTVTLSGGQGTLALPLLAAGSHALVLSYTGDNDFNPATDAITQTVNKAVTLVSTTSSLNPAIAGQPVTFVATLSVTSPGNGLPTGTITFFDGGASIGSVAVSATQTSFSISSLTGGSHTITATYSGDGNFAPSTSAALNQTINVPDFTVIVMSPEGTITVGNSFKTGIEVTPTYGFTGTVNLTCNSDVPLGSCSIAPANGKLDGHTPLAATVTIQTTGNPSGTASLKPLNLRGIPMFAVAIFGLPLAVLRKKKRCLGLLLGAALFVVGCGSGGSAKSSPTPVKSTPPGTYTITVQAQSGSVTHSSQLALVVK